MVHTARCRLDPGRTALNWLEHTSWQGVMLSSNPCQFISCSQWQLHLLRRKLFNLGPVTCIEWGILCGSVVPGLWTLLKRRLSYLQGGPNLLCLPHLRLPQYLRALAYGNTHFQKRNASTMGSQLNTAGRAHCSYDNLLRLEQRYNRTLVLRKIQNGRETLENERINTVLRLNW